MNGIFEYAGEFASAIIAFLTGIVIAFWRIISILAKVNILEQRISKIERDIMSQQSEINTLETRLIDKLDRLDHKLDEFILNFIKK